VWVPGGIRPIGHTGSTETDAGSNVLRPIGGGSVYLGRVRSSRGAASIIMLAVAVVFLGIEAVEAVIAADALPTPLRFAAFHTVGVVVFGALAVVSVVAAVFLSARWLVLVIGACIVAAALALFLV